MKSGPDGQDDRISQHGVKIDRLLQVVLTMQVQMTDMQEQMDEQNRTVMDLTNKKAEEKEENGQFDSHIKEQMNSMQTQMTKIVEITSKKKEDVNEVSGTNVTEVVEALADQTEKELKKNNVIMFNMPEPTVSDKSKEMKDDIELVKDVLAVVHPNIGEVEIDEENTTRLGERKIGHTRPIRIKFRDDSCKGVIFRNSPKLKSHDKFSKVNISNDKTRKELMADRLLKDKLKTEREVRPQEDLIIYKGEIIPRANRPPPRVQQASQRKA